MKVTINENFIIYKNQMKFDNYSCKLHVRQFKGKAEYLDLIETASIKNKQEA